MSTTCDHLYGKHRECRDCEIKAACREGQVAADSFMADHTARIAGTEASNATIAYWQKLKKSQRK